MPFLASRTSFPSFERSRDFFRSGIGPPPAPRVQQPRISGGAPTPQTGGPVTQEAPQTGGPVIQEFTPQQQPTTTAPAAPQAPTPSQSQVPPAVQAQTPQAPAPQAAPVNLGYQTQGTLEERLFQPVQQATQVGEEQLRQFADLFRQQAGPSRTFAGIGGAGTLEAAVQGGAMDPARALVGAQYTGPQGLDPTAAGNLMDLASRLRTRQQALGTGGGLATTIRQSTPGATGGEARFTARDILDPEYRQRLAQATAGVDPFAQQLETEITGAGEFARQRAGEEEDIARQAREYLTGRRGGITEDIQSEIDRRLQQQLQARELFGRAVGTEDPEALAGILRRAQESGALAEGVDPAAFQTDIFRRGQEAQALERSIMEKPEYESISKYGPAERGASGSGRGTLTYYIDGKDYRQVIPDKRERNLFLKRQQELERSFDPLTAGVRRGEESAFLNPLYLGGEFQGPQAAQYLEFDPGMRPSRGNVSTEEQRSQFNTINDLLGNLDRISKDESPFRAAIIGANIERYLEDEEAALEAQTGELSQAAKEWRGQVKKMRKAYRKAKRSEEYGKIGAVVGGLLLGQPGLGQQIGQGAA